MRWPRRPFASPIEAGDADHRGTRARPRSPVSIPRLRRRTPPRGVTGRAGRSTGAAPTTTRDAARPPPPSPTPRRAPASTRRPSRSPAGGIAWRRSVRPGPHVGRLPDDQPGRAADLAGTLDEVLEVDRARAGAIPAAAHRAALPAGVWPTSRWPVAISAGRTCRRRARRRARPDVLPGTRSCSPSYGSGSTCCSPRAISDTGRSTGRASTWSRAASVGHRPLRLAADAAAAQPAPGRPATAARAAGPPARRGGGDAVQAARSRPPARVRRRGRPRLGRADQGRVGRGRGRLGRPAPALRAGLALWRAAGRSCRARRERRHVLPRAAELADRLGARPLRERIEASATAGPASRSAAWPAVSSLGLTPRELEVLRLVADGRSNREIAGELFISAKTASVHVSNILAKLRRRLTGRGRGHGPPAEPVRLRVFDGRRSQRAGSQRPERPGAGPQRPERPGDWITTRTAGRTIWRDPEHPE